MTNEQERVLEPNHCPALDASGNQCRRRSGHASELLHYARSCTWRGDYTQARREQLPDEPLVKSPAPVDFFMDKDNPFGF